VVPCSRRIERAPRLVLEGEACGGFVKMGSIQERAMRRRDKDAGGAGRRIMELEA
jgi:hypothetical protein